MRLKNKVALITGGTSGIGEATALLFASEGAKVGITGRNSERGAGVVARVKANGGHAVFFRADVSLAEDCRRAVEETLRAFGSLDILFNNAGVFYPQTAIECSEKEWDEQIDVNLKGTFLMSKFALPDDDRAGERSASSTTVPDGAWLAAIMRWLTARPKVESC